jgi:hypothetical protein
LFCVCWRGGYSVREILDGEVVGIRWRCHFSYNFYTDLGG